MNSATMGAGSAVPEDLDPVRRLGQVRGFDGMRGIAAILVVVTHFEIIFPIPTFAVIPGGTVPLDLFYVLSGFLITSLLLREQGVTGKVRRWAFYERRILRLYPALIVVIIAQFIYGMSTGISFHEEWTSILSVAFYYSNWKLALHSNVFGGNIANGFQQMWSLSFEEQFYLIWPWITIYFLTIRSRLRTVVLSILALIIIIGVHRALLYNGPNTWYELFIRTDTRADSLLWGALAAHLWIRRKEPARFLPIMAWVASIFLLICLPFAGTVGPFLYRGGFDAIDISCAILILAVVDGRWKGTRFFEWKPLVAVGLVSYGIYVWHILVLFGVEHFGSHLPDVVKAVIAVSIITVLVLLSWFLLERPSLRWKKRLSFSTRANRRFSRGPGSDREMAAKAPDARKPVTSSMLLAPRSSETDAGPGARPGSATVPRLKEPGGR